MDLLKELEARDERIEKLEKALLLVLSSKIGNHVDPSSQNYLSNVQTFAVKRVKTLVAECGSTEKVIQELLDLGEKKLSDEQASLRR